LSEKITLLDGAMGTALWQMAEENGVERAPVWRYNIEHPEFVREMHRRYLAAGTTLISSNTFDINALTAVNSPYSVAEVVSAGARIARECADEFGARVLLSSGPLPKLLKPYGQLSQEECLAAYAEITAAGAEYADGILFETFLDVEMMKLAVAAAKETSLPVFCSFTFAKRRRTVMGDSIERMLAELTPLGISAIGINCSFGPEDALPVIEEFREKTELPLFLKPNAGVGEGCSAEQFADKLEPALGYVSYVGACCGSDESFIREIGKRL